ncbi:ABC transporter G member 32 [Orobanche hederae]
MSIGLFRVMTSLGRNMVVANTVGSFALLVVLVLGGFILSRDSIPIWWILGYWFSPVMYAQNAASVNEFLGHSWNKQSWKQHYFVFGRKITEGAQSISR